MHIGCIIFYDEERVERFYTAIETGRNSLRDGIHEWMESKEGKNDLVVTTCIANEYDMKVSWPYSMVSKHFSLVSGLVRRVKVKISPN